MSELNFSQIFFLSTISLWSLLFWPWIAYKHFGSLWLNNISRISSIVWKSPSSWVLKKMFKFSNRDFNEHDGATQ